MTGKLLRLWQFIHSGSITIEAELIWWNNWKTKVRQRKIDLELRLPYWLWRPYCWLVQNHSIDNKRGTAYYGYCVCCQKRVEEWPRN